MQEGEALHSSPAVKMVVRVRIALFVVTVLIASPDGAGSGGNPIPPGAYLDPFVSLVAGEYLLCYSSYAELYGIDGLHAHSAMLGTRIERFAIWVLWEVCTHSLYRMDELRVRLCSERLGLPLSIVLEPAMRRERVKGFPAGNSPRLSAAVILETAGLSFSIYRKFTGEMGVASTLVACSVSIDGFAITAAGHVMDRRLSLLDMEGRLMLGGAMSLRSGYRLDTDEIRCGLECRRGGLLVSVLWSHHPILGRTVTLGVGHVWTR